MLIYILLIIFQANLFVFTLGAPLIEPPPEPYKPPDKCCVGICGKVRGPGTVLFRFPDASKYPLLNQPAVARRRDAWLNAVGWTELVIQQNPPTLYICSEHFQGSKDERIIRFFNLLTNINLCIFF